VKPDMFTLNIKRIRGTVSRSMRIHPAVGVRVSWPSRETKFGCGMGLCGRLIGNDEWQGGAVV